MRVITVHSTLSLIVCQQIAAVVCGPKLGLHQVHANVGLHCCLQVTMPFAIRKHTFFS